MSPQDLINKNTDTSIFRNKIVGKIMYNCELYIHLILSYKYF